MSQFGEGHFAKKAFDGDYGIGRSEEKRNKGRGEKGIPVTKWKSNKNIWSNVFRFEFG